MKTLKTIIACSIFVFVGLMNTYGQIEKTTKDILMQNEWVITHQSGDAEFIFSQNFTNKTVTETIEHNGKNYKVYFDYYLSDRFETTFDENKIGKVMQGKYIIMRKKPDSKIYVYEITKISETEYEFFFFDLEQPLSRSVVGKKRTFLKAK